MTRIRYQQNLDKPEQQLSTPILIGNQAIQAVITYVKEDLKFHVKIQDCFTKQMLCESWADSGAEAKRSAKQFLRGMGGNFQAEVRDRSKEFVETEFEPPGTIYTAEDTTEDLSDDEDRWQQSQDNLADGYFSPMGGDTSGTEDM